MEIRFNTKEDSKNEQVKEFLRLSGGERFLLFLKQSMLFNQFSTKREYDTKNNFLIDFTKHDK
jgi:hypothetical protein